MPRHKPPHVLAATEPPELLANALVRNLAEAVDGSVAYCVPSATQSTTLTVVAEWPKNSAKAQNSLGEVVREPVAGGGVVIVAKPGRWGDGECAAAQETAGWLGVVAELNRSRIDRERAEARAHSLRAEVMSTRNRFAQVRELERRRLVRSITATILRDLNGIRRQLRRLGELRSDSAAEGVTDATAGEIAEARTALDDLLDNFRTVVRGVYPAMLPDRGPRAALEELAATLPCPVRFGGDLGRRVRWEIESTLYHAVAAVLTVLAGQAEGHPVSVEFDRDDVLRVRITTSVVPMSAAELRTVLDHDAERIAVLGGGMECAVTDGATMVTVRLAERIEPFVAAGSAEPERSACYRRVRDVVRQGQQVAGDGPDGALWHAMANRMVEPARVAVVTGESGDFEGRQNVENQKGLGVTVIVVTGPADWDLAHEFLADEGPRGSIDAALCLVPPTPAFRATLRSGRQRVTVTESATLPELARKLVARQPVIAARRALVTLNRLAPSLPADHSLWREIDRVRAEQHEIAELDLLDELEEGGNRLLRGVVVDATRLLGAQGTDPRTRLGLAAHAEDEQVWTAADQAARRWRALAEQPSTSGRDRWGCEVLVRTAEGILIAGRARRR